MHCLGPCSSKSLVRRCDLAIALWVVSIALAACRSETAPSEDAAVDYRENPLYALTGNEAQIVSVNFQIFSRLDFFRHINDSLFSPRERTVAWAELKRDLGFEPVRRIERIVIGFYGNLNLDDPFADCAIIVTGDLGDPEKFLKESIRYGESGLVTDPQSLKRTLYGQGSLFETQLTSAASGAEIHLTAAFPVPGVAVFSRSRERVTDCVDVIEGRAASVTASSYWKTHLDRVDYSAIVWGAGDMPRSIVDYLGEKSRDRPTLAGFAGIGRAHSFHASLQSKENVFIQVGLVCQSIDVARALTRDLEIARPSIPQLVSLWHPKGSPKHKAWIKTLDEILVSTITTTSAMSLRLDDGDASGFLKTAIGEPTPTPPPLNIPPPFLAH